MSKKLKFVIRCFDDDTNPFVYYIYNETIVTVIASSEIKAISKAKVICKRKKYQVKEILEG